MRGAVYRIETARAVIFPASGIQLQIHARARKRGEENSDRPSLHPCALRVRPVPTGPATRGELGNSEGEAHESGHARPDDACQRIKMIPKPIRSRVRPARLRWRSLHQSRLEFNGGRPMRAELQRRRPHAIASSRAVSGRRDERREGVVVQAAGAPCIW